MKAGDMAGSQPARTRSGTGTLSTGVHRGGGAEARSDGIAVDPLCIDLHPEVRTPMRRTVRRPNSVYTRHVKPTIDRSAASAALVVVALPMAVISGVILVTMGRPVLFRQQRVGLDGSVFNVLKFRTMRPDRRRRHQNVGSDRRVTHKTTADPRHTATGMFLRRFSLDELPQLINVVRGEMSIVGPRPELVGVVDTYGDDLHHLHQRHYVKPGLTGLWQVSARSDGPMHENGEWDLDYVEQVSLRADLAIIAKTPSAMLGENRGT